MSELKIEDFNLQNLNTPEFRKKYLAGVVKKNKELMEKVKINRSRMNIKHFTLTP